MSVIIRRLLPRFTAYGLLLLAVGQIGYFALLEYSSIAQADPNEEGVMLVSKDIGVVGQEGSYAIDGQGGLVVSSWGSDIWDVRDGFHYAFQAWRGDGEFIVRLNDLDAAHPRARAGIMIRSTLFPDSINAFVSATPSGEVHFLRRTVSGSDTVDDAHTNLGMTTLEDRAVYQRRFTDLHPKDKSTVNQPGIPRWLRLVRMGDSFHAYDSGDGNSWEWIGTESIAMGDDVFVGLAVSSHDLKGACTATFSDLRFSDPSLEAIAQSLLVSPVVGSGDGLRGRYFRERNFEDLAFERIDPQLDFVWSHEAIADGMPKDHFSIRFEGLLEAQYSEPYLLHLISDEQAMLWLDGRLLIDDWFEHRATQTSALVNLEAGRKYHIRVDYTEAIGHAMVSLGWSSPSTMREVIPQSQLYSRLDDRDGNSVPDAWEESFGVQLEGGSRGDLGAGGIEKLESFYLKGLHPLGRSGRARAVVEAPGWKSLDISPAGPDGAAEVVSGSVRQKLTASGARYGEVDGLIPHVVRDKFHFSYQPRSGSQEMVARIIDIEEAEGRTMAGLMVRQTTDADSPFVAVMLGNRRESWILARERAGYSARMQRVGFDAKWLKLQRYAGGVRLYESIDGFTWRWLATEPFVVEGEACFGLAVQGDGMAAQSSVEFGGVEIRALNSFRRGVPPVQGNGNGLLGNYSDGFRDFVRNDPTVDFFWPEGVGPGHELNENNFNVRWEGELQAQYTEAYSIELRCDDGARLWLDGLLLLDDWRDSGDYPQSIRLELEAGKRYPIRIEYYDATGEASARLSWSSPSTVKQVIPSSQLHPSIGTETFGLVGRGTSLLRPQKEDTETIEQGLFGPPNPLAKEVNFIEQVETIELNEFESVLGKWELDEQGLVCQSRRGVVEFAFSVSDSGMYLLEFIGEAVESHPDPNYLLWIELDGLHLSRRLLTGESRKEARQLTPWLDSGRHRLRVFWDNTLPGRSLRIVGIDVKVFRGVDEDQDNVPDWMTDELASSNRVDDVIESIVSPALIEGDAVYPELVTLSTRRGEWEVFRGAGERWFANVPLLPDRDTDVELKFENSGYSLSHVVKWKPTDLTNSGNLLIRDGDALLFTFGPETENSYGGELRIGDVVKNVQPGQSVAFDFNESGRVPIVAIWSPGQKVHRFYVDVVGQRSVSDIAAMVGSWREWSLKGLPDGLVFEPDPQIELGLLASKDDGGLYKLRTSVPLRRYVNLRLADGGSILQRIPVDGFRLDYGNRTGAARVSQVFEDSSRLVEADAVLTPVHSSVNVVGSILAGGILFESGRIREIYTSRHFDELGVLTQSFYQTSDSKTSVCHHLDAFQGEFKLNEF